MRLDQRVEKIMEKAYQGIAADRDDCLYLLGFSEKSPEAYMMRMVTNDIIRSRTDNSAIILGQIGVDVSPCPGGCEFCSFGERHTSFTPHRMSDRELTEKVHDFADGGDLYGLYLMAMHDYDLSYLLHAVALARAETPDTTQIWVNVGDSDVDDFCKMRDTGVTGVYHVCRIGEGRDTNLKAEDRIRTMDAALEAGLELYTCCEPIGPEHTNEEIVENMFIGIERGIYQHAAMRRVAVPGTPLARYGQISETRLAQIVAVIGLATLQVKTMAYLGVHEANELGYTSGANIVTAESGINPRDTLSDTAKGRGFDVQDCRKLFWECGFENLRRGDESKVALTLEYIQEKER